MTTWQLLCFSLLSGPLAMAGFAVVSFVPTYYAVDLGLGLAAVGAVVMFGRFLDVFTDPLIGWLSDRSRSRWGPRKPWIFLSAPGLMLFAWLLLAPPQAVGPVYLFCALSGYLIFLTLFDLPYSSIGLEISPHRHERSVLAGTKAVFQILGALTAALAPVLIAAQMGASLNAIALVFVLMVPLALVTFALWTPRYKDRATVQQPNLWATWRGCLGDASFRRLLISFFAVQAANALTVGLLVLFVTHILQAPELVGQMFLALLLATALFVPLWTMLSRQIGKRQTWTAAMIACAAVLLAACLIGPGDVLAMQLICVGLGACFTCDAVMPTSMLADIVARDEAESGGSKAASYLALKNAASKMAFVAPMGLAFPLLGWVGLDDGAAASPQAAAMLLFFFAGLPAIIRLGVAVVLTRSKAVFTTEMPAE